MPITVTERHPITVTKREPEPQLRARRDFVTYLPVGAFPSVATPEVCAFMAQHGLALHLEIMDSRNFGVDDGPLLRVETRESREIVKGDITIGEREAKSVDQRHLLNDQLEAIIKGQ